MLKETKNLRLINKLGFSLIFLLCISACNSEKIDMPGLDIKAFKTDRGACEDKRPNLVNDLKAEKDSLIGKSENAIIKYLGRYDKQLLDERNTKIFIYYLAPGSHCQNPAIPSDALSMAVWFNATKMAKEITFQQGLP